MRGILRMTNRVPAAASSDEEELVVFVGKEEL
jgi:hypothetical protein